MKKIVSTLLLIFVLFIAGVCLVGYLDWSLVRWSFVACVPFALRLIVLATKKPKYDDFGYTETAFSILGIESTWWEERGEVLVEDYTSGKISLLIYRWLISIVGIVAIVFLLIKGAIWLFTNRIFWIIVGSIAGTALAVGVGILLTKLVKKLLIKQYGKLRNQYIDEAHIPMPLGAINKQNYKYCKAEFEAIKSLTDALSIASPDEIPTIKEDLLNKKLEVFFRVSKRTLFKKNIQPENIDKIMTGIYTALNEKNYNALRFRRNTDENNKETLEILSKQLSLLRDNRMTPLLNELQRLKDMDTSMLGGLITDSSKLADKAKLLNDIYEAAVSEYEELDKCRDAVNVELEWERLEAYESIYLGAELLNVLRDNAGGSKLSKADSLVEMNLDLSDVDTSNAGQDYSITELASSSLYSMLDRIANDENFASYVIESPKEALGEEALNFIGNLIHEHIQSIERNNAVIQQITSKLPEMTEAYTYGQAQIIRAIEITLAIMKANSGFNKIYNPIFEKVFINKDIASVSLKEQHLLTNAIKEFNNIAKAQL